jgi:hypothetical protein
LDDHEDFITDDQKFILIDKYMTSSNNLMVQSSVISGASSFYGTYGGLSYLPLFYGVSSYSFYDSTEGLNWSHLQVANLASQELGASFVAMDVENGMELCGL